MQCLEIFILVTVVAISSQQSIHHGRNNRIENGLSQWDDLQEIFNSNENERSYTENKRLYSSKTNEYPNQYDEWSTSNADRYRQQPKLLKTSTKKPKLRVIYKKRYRTRNKSNVHSESNRDSQLDRNTGRQRKIINKKAFRFKNRYHDDEKYETVKKELNKQSQVNSNSYERRTKTYRSSEHKDGSHKESGELSDVEESITVPEERYRQNALKEIQSASADFIKMLVKKLCGQYEKQMLDLEHPGVASYRGDKDTKSITPNGKPEEVTLERLDNTLKNTSEILDKMVDVTADKEDKTAAATAEKEYITAKSADKTSDLRADVTTKSVEVGAETAHITSEKSDVATERADVFNKKVDEPAKQADVLAAIANVSAYIVNVTPAIEDNITDETAERVDKTAELSDEAAERLDETTDITAEITDVTAKGQYVTVAEAGETANRANAISDVTSKKADTDVTAMRARLTVEKTDKVAENADVPAEKANERADRADAEIANTIAGGRDKPAQKVDLTADKANLPHKKTNTTADVTAERTKKTAEVNAEKADNSAVETVENDDQMIKITTERYNTATELPELDKLLQVSAERENMAAQYMYHGRPSDVLDERENKQLILTDLDQTVEEASKKADKNTMGTSEIVMAIFDKPIEAKPKPSQAKPKQPLESNNDQYWLKVNPIQHSETNVVSEQNPLVNVYYHRLLLDLLAKHKLRAKDSDKWKIDKIIALTKNSYGNINPELLYKYLHHQKIIDWDKLLYLNLDVEDTPETLKYYLLIKDSFERFGPDKENVAKFVSSLQNRNVKVHSKLLVLLSEMLRTNNQESPDHPMMVVVNDNKKMQELILQRIQLYADKVPLQERKKIASIVKIFQKVELKTPPRLHNTYLLDYLNSHKPEDIDWDEVFNSIQEAKNNKSSDENRIEESRTTEIISNCDENYKKLRRTVEYILGLMNDKNRKEKLKINP